MMESVLSYAEERELNIARNKATLVSLDLEKLKPRTEPKEIRHKNWKNLKNSASNKRKADADLYSDSDIDADVKPHAKTARIGNDENAVPQPGQSTESRRRSSRLAGLSAQATERVERSRGTPQPLSVKTIVEDASGQSKRERRYNPKTYGSIPGIEVGSWWASREECSKDAIHAPWVGGIAPGPNGAYSIALSGGYDDDVDEGYAFTYTGGRDLKGTKAAPKNLRTAGQSFDQSFEHNHNKALKRSVETGKPVRVIRGYKLRSKYGPSEGYRYDGLYAVRKYWQEKGLNKGGFLVCKYAFVRLPDQPAIAVKGMDEEEADEVQHTLFWESDAEGEAASEE
ncbi:PUA-like domain-containing protein [Butyriboletus roseoflavus]|nr:PUA-like domain-containing protein [Butyriboletus roseoflavus]